MGLLRLTTIANPSQETLADFGGEGGRGVAESAITDVTATDTRSKRTPAAFIHAPVQKPFEQIEGEGLQIGVWKVV